MDRTPSVLFTVAQSLTGNEKKQARTNIGATAGVVSFDPNSTGISEMISAAIAGDTAIHGSGSSLVPYSVSVSGAYPELHTFANGKEEIYKWNGTQWVHSSTEFISGDSMDFTKIGYPTVSETPGTVLFTAGIFNVCGYLDNAGALRLCVVPTDGKDHSIYANGGGYRCYATDGAIVSTNFTTTNTYMKLYVVDNGYWESSTSSLTPTDWTMFEAEIYAFPNSSVVNSSILYRISKPGVNQ